MNASQTVGTAVLPPLTLWVLPVAELGGVGRHVLDVASTGLPGLRLAVLCPPGPLADELRGTGAAVLQAPFGPDAGFVASVRLLARTVDRLRPAAVHSHLAHADVVAATALARRRDVRLLSTEHGIADVEIYHATRARAWAALRAHRLRLRRADALIAVSESTRRTMLRRWHPGTPVTVIRNAVDASAIRSVIGPRRLRKVGEGIRILSLARLAPEKRIDSLLRALPEIRRIDPAATVTVAGIGPEGDRLQALATDLGIADAVRFPGFVDPWPAMRAHDVVVQLSAWENLSYTLLDARAAGMPAVATAVGGNGEILPPARLITELTAEAVAEAVVAALGHPGESGAPSGTGTTDPFDVVLPGEWTGAADGGLETMTARIAAVTLGTLEQGVRP